MMMGALLGGISFHKGLGVVHSLSHALGRHRPRAPRNAQRHLAAARLRFNREAAGPRMAELGSRLGLGRGGDAAGHLVTLTELVLARMPIAPPARRSSTGSNATGSPNTPGSRCSTTATRPIPARATRRNWKICWIGLGEVRGGD